MGASGAPAQGWTYDPAFLGQIADDVAEVDGRPTLEQVEAVLMELSREASAGGQQNLTGVPGMLLRTIPKVENPKREAPDDRA